jgi:RNA polymerase sigma-70 factor, ECF subfamily
MSDKPAFVNNAPKLDQEALLAVFDQYAPAIYRYALRLCHDPIASDSIVGDVFEQLLEHFAAGGSPPGNLRHYFYRIAYHLLQNYPHRNQHLTTDSPGALIAESAQIEERVHLDVLISALDNTLTDIQRHVIILRFVEGFSEPETAEIVGKSINALQMIQNRAISKLSRALSFQFTSDSPTGHRSGDRNSIPVDQVRDRQVRGK